MDSFFEDNKNLCDECPLNLKKNNGGGVEFPPLSVEMSGKEDFVLNLILADIPKKDSKVLIKKIVTDLLSIKEINETFSKITIFPRNLCLKSNTFAATSYCLTTHLKDSFINKNSLNLLMGSASYKITNYFAKFNKNEECEHAEGGDAINGFFVQKNIEGNFIISYNTSSLGVIGRDLYTEDLKDLFIKDIIEKTKRAVDYFNNKISVEKGKIIEDDSFLTDPEVEIIENISQLEKHIDYLLKNSNKHFAFDSETLIGNLLSPEWYRENFSFACAALSYKNDEKNIINIAIPFKKGYTETKEAFTAEGISKSKELLKKLFMTPRKGLIIGHNLLFDLNAVCNALDIPSTHFATIRANLLDTIILAHLVDEDRFSFKLGDLAIAELGFKPWKGVIDLYNENPDDLETFFKLLAYNAKDTAATYHLYEKFLNELKEDNEEALPLLVCISKVLRNILILEHKGSKISDDAINTIETYYNKVEEDSATRLFEIIEKRSKGEFTEETFNLKSNKQLIEFFKKIGVALTVKTEKGAPKIDKHVLDKLSTSHKVDEEIKEFCKTLLLYKESQKMKSAFINNYVNYRDSKGFVHPSIQFHGTVTGRVSVRNPNIQQIPKHGPIKQVYIPRDEGRILVAADYSQAEVRTIAMFSQEHFLMDSFEAGLDPYKQLATKVYLKDYADINKKERLIMKTVLLASIYGQTKWGLAGILGITPEEAERISFEFYKEVPRLKEYQDDRMREVMNTNFVLGATFRKRRFNQLRMFDGNKRQKFAVLEKTVRAQALNAPIQGSTSDTALYNVACVSERILEEKIEAIPISVVHDSVMFDVSEKDAVRLYEIMEELLPKAHPLFIKFLKKKYGEDIRLVRYDIEAKAGYNYGDFDEKENPKGMKIIKGIKEGRLLLT